MVFAPSQEDTETSKIYDVLHQGTTNYNTAGNYHSKTKTSKQASKLDNAHRATTRTSRSKVPSEATGACVQKFTTVYIVYLEHRDRTLYHLLYRLVLGKCTF